MNPSPAGLAETPLLDVADRALEEARLDLPAGSQAELFLCRGRERGIELREGRVETLQESCEEGMGLRVLHEGRLGFACVASLDLDALREAARQVREQLPWIPADPHRALPGPGRAAEPLDAMTDPSLLQEPLEGRIPELRDAEALALRSDARARRILRLGYGESYGEAAVVNTLGVRAHEGGTVCSFGLVAVAERDTQVQLGAGSAIARFRADLDFGVAAREAAFRAGVFLDSKKLPTARRAVLFDPWVAGEFLELLARAMSAEEVQRGKSLFRGKLGRRVASPLVTLVDDPRLPRGIASSSFDDEGVPSRRKPMVEAGVLSGFFYDTYTARKEGLESNGSAGRGSYRGTPGPSSTNFFMERGSGPRERLIRETRDGVLVLEVMGMHTADPISGEFSVGISGVAVQGGELTHGVRGMMLSGNILDLLERVDAVADDLVFYGRLAAPTFRAADMAMA